MSSIINLLNRLFPTKEYRILSIGLDYVGKTTFLYRILLGETVRTIPTIGFNVETVSYKGRSLTIWDVGSCVLLVYYWYMLI